MEDESEKCDLPAGHGPHVMLIAIGMKKPDGKARDEGKPEKSRDSKERKATGRESRR